MMAKSRHAVPRECQTPQYLCAVVLEQLVQVFLFCSPQSNREVFIQEIYQPLRLANIDGDTLARYWKDHNNGKFHLAHIIQICCAFCVQASRVMSNHDLAMSYIVDAHLYLGMATAGMASAPQIEHLQNEVAKNALSTNARKCVAVSVDPWHKTKAEAERLIRALAATGTRWTTPTEAARVIGNDVEQFLQALKVGKRFQGTPQRDVCIADWLREMPEAAEFFGPKS